MKKLLIALLSLFILLSSTQVFAINAELDNAITKLYAHGPDAQIEETLKRMSRSSDQNVAERAEFHLVCLHILKGDTAVEKSLTKLEQNVRNNSEKETVKMLREILQKGKKIPEQPQDKISLDMKNARIKDIVAVIARIANTNIIVHNKITDKINLKLTNASVKQAIETICRIADLRFENNDGVFIILPKSASREKYEKREIKLAFLLPEEAFKIALSELRANTHAESQNVTFKTTRDSIIMEGELAALDKFEAFLRNFDEKGKAHKISFRIWKTNAGKIVSAPEFVNMDDSKKKEVATIIAAPTLTTVTGKEAKIEIGESINDDEKNFRRPMSYFMSCIICETSHPDLIRLIGHLRIVGSFQEDGKTVDIKKEYSPTLDIDRNKWAILPFYEGKDILMQVI